ncbi:hypothetical protein F4821DRAFT_182203 [Hypoxylon rubiginosum]|uniref:Uncharacterized protein n=1 Tax=Hypoxylon rubiginosum TaxID=110542 RepID=A0ACC0CUD3_9PEZI|nr:hypothetical protein F4821DRAFT_182203 [Hypoxylon rubiginosum]
MDSERISEEPPPYTIVATNDTNPDEIPINSLTSHLQDHVKSLPDRIRAAQQARKVEQGSIDVSLLDRLIPIVEGFLVELGARHDPVSLATLTLVPDGAVPKDAKLSDSEDTKRRGELSRVVKVWPGKDSKSDSGKSKPQYLSEDPSWVPGQEFSGWGRFGETSSPTGDGSEDGKTLWWTDEEMAHRLASYLQPKKEQRAPMERSSVVQTVVEQRIPPKKEKRGWGWRRQGNAKDSPEASHKPADTYVEASKLQDMPNKNEAEMMISAQEVAFRHENEFGIWESFRGWGIVVAVKIEN